MSRKLHELLAVEGNLSTQAAKVRTDLSETFSKKRHLFEEKRKTYTANTEGAAPVTEEQQDIQSTVASELKWAFEMFAKAFDAGHQIDVSNTTAKANIILEGAAAGEVFLRDVPATSLLQLEKRVKEVRDLVAAIPTLDPAKGFAPDAAKGKGIYMARDVRKPRTRKAQKPLVLYQATKEHPAQTQLIVEDEVTGTILDQEWSALLTPAVKADMLNRCDVLIRALKSARARANDMEVPAEASVGKTVLDYIYQPLA